MIPENRPVFAYTTTPVTFIDEYESVQRALVRLQLRSGSTTYKIVDGFNQNNTRKITFSKTLKKDIFLVSNKITKP